MATKNDAKQETETSDVLPAEQLIQRSGAAVAVTLNGRNNAPGETLWATAAPVQNRIETVSRVDDDQKDHGAILDRLAKRAEEQGIAGPITLPTARAASDLVKEERTIPNPDDNKDEGK